MPPVFGPLVAVVGRLVILQRRQRDDRAAVGDRHHAHLDAVEPLLDQDAPWRRRRTAGRRRATATAASAAARSRAHEHSLAGRESVGLHHDRHVFAGLEKLAGPRRRSGTRETSPSARRRGGGSACRRACCPRVCAARAVGPKIRRPAAVKASTMPATSGASGPTTVRSTPRLRATATQAGMSVAATATFSAIGRRARIAGGDEHLRSVAGELPRQAHAPGRRRRRREHGGMRAR